MDRVTVFRHIKKQDSTLRTLSVVLTPKLEKGRINCYESEGATFICKPVGLENFSKAIWRINHFLEVVDLLPLRVVSS